jgi:hypothetical protein
VYARSILDYARLGNPLIITLLVIHGVLAVMLLGAATHQAMAGHVEARSTSSFARRYRGVDATLYARLIVGLFLATALLGSVLYPSYRVIVRPFLESADLRGPNGVFEIKEHLVALGLLLLPAYWAAWRPRALPAQAAARRPLIGLLAAIVWFAFLVGHVVSAIRGLYR